MKRCRKPDRRLRESAGTLDSEQVKHCLACPECRRELAALLAADDPGAPPVPERLDRTVFAACRNGRKRRDRYRAARVFTWVGGAAAAAACSIVLGLHLTAAPETPQEPPGKYAFDPEWDGAELIAELADIGSRLALTHRQLAGENSGEMEFSI